jgi:uncharacterized damage-inducible protein DinB
MYTNAQQFVGAYKHESETTQKVLKAVSDASLVTEKTPGDLSIRDLAWHVATGPGHMLNHEGFPFESNSWQTPEGISAADLTAKHAEISAGVLAFAQSNLADADFNRDANWFGFTLPLGVWMNMIVNHEVHHRGQLTVLMRQAGLTVPSIYGPNKEETAEMMAKMAAGEAGAH